MIFCVALFRTAVLYHIFMCGRMRASNVTVSKMAENTDLKRNIRRFRNAESEKNFNENIPSIQSDTTFLNQETKKMV